MIATLLSAATVVLGAVLCGQLLCAAAGARRWTWAAPAVGLSAMIVIAVPGLHLPGRLTIPFIAILALSVAGVVLLVRRPAHRPPLLAGVPMLLAGAVVLIPFFAARRFGTLGVSFQNDMFEHLLLAGIYRDPVIQHATPLLDYYPLGPHALVATIAHGWGIGIDGTFAGFTIAMPLLTALTAYGFLSRLPRGAAVLAALAAAAQYLSVAYLGQASFKELSQITLLVGLVAALVGLRDGTLLGRGRLVPLGLIIAGMLSIYSLPALAWAGLIVGGVAICAAVVTWYSHGWAGFFAAARSYVVPSAIGLAALVVVLIPQAPRLKAFYDWTTRTGTGTGIAKTDLGNLAGPLDPLQATGAWLSADFRFAPVDASLSKFVAILILAAAVWGLVRLARRGELELAIAAVACAALWWYSDRTQSPYVAAKALVLASPFVVLLAAIGLLEGSGERTRVRAARWLVAAGIFVMLAVSSFETLRFLPVGPRTHELQLAALRPLVRGDTVMYLGGDEFASWELSGARVVEHVTGGYAIAPDKPWVYGQPLDWDSVSPAALDSVNYVVTPDDASASQPPPNFRRVRRSGAFALYRRTGPTQPRLVLPESGAAGAVLNCKTPAGRKLLRAGGVAAVRPAPVMVAVPALPQGASADVPTPPLAAGRYRVGLRYVSAQPMHITAPGFDVVAPASLDRPGAAWPLGPLTLTAAGPVTFRVATHRARLVSPTAIVAPSVITLTPDTPVRVVPLARACGRFVDWYRTARV